MSIYCPIGGPKAKSMDLQTQPLVSVVTPVYNGEKYLAECIESILAQTYQNWEYIIVNNCSTDRSLEIAQGYAKKDARIRIYNNQEFVGMIQNHNIALGQISSESKYGCVPLSTLGVFYWAVRLMIPTM